MYVKNKSLRTATHSNRVQNLFPAGSNAVSLCNLTTLRVARAFVASPSWWNKYIYSWRISSVCSMNTVLFQWYWKRWYETQHYIMKLIYFKSHSCPIEINVWEKRSILKLHFSFSRLCCRFSIRITSRLISTFQQLKHASSFLSTTEYIKTIYLSYVKNN